MFLWQLGEDSRDLGVLKVVTVVGAVPALSR